MGTTEQKRQYDRAFKERAVKLSQGRDNIKELARELGVSPERIYKWRAEFAQHGEASLTSSSSLTAFSSSLQGIVRKRPLPPASFVGSRLSIAQASLALRSACRRFQGRGVERLSEEGKQVKELQKKLRNTELELEILRACLKFPTFALFRSFRPASRPLLTP